MIASLAQYMADILLKNEIIDNKKLDIYIYGFEVLISSIVSILIAFLIGLLFSQLIECTVFLAIFIYLRMYSGGYHADTYFKCNIFFTINLIIVMIIIKKSIHYSVYVCLAIDTFCVLIILLWAPIENKYKPIEKYIRKKFKTNSLFLAMLFSALTIIEYKINIHYCIVINTALLSVAVSMIIEKIKNGGNRNENEI